VVFAELGDEAVLLNTDTGVYFGLDSVGMQIWKLLLEGETEPRIHARLLGEYAVTPESLREDIAAFLQSLEQRGLVTIAAAAS
jgi:hypothetical protein